ncbi:MAG: hypothetical protein WBX11_03015 [Thiobacillaceae bacterium]
MSSALYVDASEVRAKPARSALIAATMLLTGMVILSKGACAQSATEGQIADGPLLLADFNEDEQQRLNPQQLRPFANEYEHQQHQQQEAQQPQPGQPPAAWTGSIGSGSEDPATSWRATPRLPPNRNPLLGRWRLVGTDNAATTGTTQVNAFAGLLGPQYTAMAQNMANSMYGATCKNLFANGGVVEFRPADFVAIEDSGATRVIARDEYHAAGLGVVMVPKDPMMAALLEFDIQGDQAKARRLGCVLQRVSLSKHPTPAPTTSVASQAAASGDAGLATLNLLIRAQPPGAGRSAPFAPASGAAVMLQTRSVDEALAAAGFAGPRSRAIWATACANHDARTCQRGLQAIMANPVAKGVANDKGQVAIAGIPPGRYYVFSIGGAGGRDYTWDVPTTLKPGSNVHFLDQSTALQPPE